jgi:drug/metabolite transporter (DMT)-like permease
MPPRRPPRTRLLIALAVVYVVWGSTYLAMRVAVVSMPAILMGGARMLAAGLILYAWARATGAPAPERRHWGPAMLIGGLLFLFGNGAVVWATQHVPSGLVALVVSAVPLWTVVLDWVRPRGVRPDVLTWLGIASGLAGIALLVDPRSMRGMGAMDPFSATVLLVGSLGWATGSLLSRHLASPRSPLIATAIQMLCGGVWMIAASLVSGEAQALRLAAIPAGAWIAFAYLVLFGSLLGFTAYVWLLRNTTPAIATTYAYVNPVVALALGWAFGGERLTARSGIAAVVIVGAVALISLARARVTARAGAAKVEERPCEGPA